MWNVEWQSVGLCWWAQPRESNKGLECWETGLDGPLPWRQVLQTGSITLTGLSHELHIGQVMLLLPLIVFVIVADAGALHVGVTGVVHVGLIVAMAMAMAIAVTPRS